MPAESKKEMFAKIKADVEASQGLFVVDYRGLSVKETQELRRSLTAAGAHMKVYKNNIVKIALEEAGQPDISDILKGTCAYVFFDKDPVATAKAIKAESDKLKKVEFLGAIAEGQALDAETAKAYADMPSREEALSMLVGALSQPVRMFARVLQEPTRSIAAVLQAFAEKDAA